MRKKRAVGAKQQAYNACVRGQRAAAVNRPSGNIRTFNCAVQELLAPG